MFRRWPGEFSALLCGRDTIVCDVQAHNDGERTDLLDPPEIAGPVPRMCDGPDSGISGGTPPDVEWYSSERQVVDSPSPPPS